jgi:CRP-like cAMP-binding protein
MPVSYVFFVISGSLSEHRRARRRRRRGQYPTQSMILSDFVSLSSFAFSTSQTDLDFTSPPGTADNDLPPATAQSGPGGRVLTSRFGQCERVVASGHSFGMPPWFPETPIPDDTLIEELPPSLLPSNAAGGMEQASPTPSHHSQQDWQAATSNAITTSTIATVVSSSTSSTSIRVTANSSPLMASTNNTSSPVPPTSLLTISTSTPRASSALDNLFGARRPSMMGSAMFAAGEASHRSQGGPGTSSTHLQQPSPSSNSRNASPKHGSNNNNISSPSSGSSLSTPSPDSSSPTLAVNSHYSSTNSIIMINDGSSPPVVSVPHRSSHAAATFMRPISPQPPSSSGSMGSVSPPLTPSATYGALLGPPSSSGGGNTHVSFPTSPSPSSDSLHPSGQRLTVEPPSPITPLLTPNSAAASFAATTSLTATPMNMPSSHLGSLPTPSGHFIRSMTPVARSSGLPPNQSWNILTPTAEGAPSTAGSVAATASGNGGSDVESTLHGTIGNVSRPLTTGGEAALKRPRYQSTIVAREASHLAAIDVERLRTILLTICQPIRYYHALKACVLREPLERSPDQIMLLARCTKYIPLFGSLNYAMRSRVANLLRYRRYEAGQVLYRQDERGENHHFYLVLSGSVSFHNTKSQATKNGGRASTSHGRTATTTGLSATSNSTNNTTAPPATITVTTAPPVATTASPPPILRSPSTLSANLLVAGSTLENRRPSLKGPLNLPPGSIKKHAAGLAQAALLNAASRVAAAASVESKDTPTSPAAGGGDDNTFMTRPRVDTRSSNAPSIATSTWQPIGRAPIAALEPLRRVNPSSINSIRGLDDYDLESIFGACVRIAAGGDGFGEESLICHTAPATVICRQPVELMMISKQDYTKLLTGDSEREDDDDIPKLEVDKLLSVLNRRAQLSVQNVSFLCDALKEVKFFREATPDARKFLVHHMFHRHVPANSLCYVEGDPCEYFYVILRGYVIHISPNEWMTLC